MNFKKRTYFENWWKSQTPFSLLENCRKCLDVKVAFLNSSSVPVCLRRLIHFDSETREWVQEQQKQHENKKYFPEEKQNLPGKESQSLSLSWPSDIIEFFDWSSEKCEQYHIPIALSHTFNHKYREKFIEGISICQQYITRNQEEFKNLQDWIDTSRIHVTEEDLKKNSRDLLPVGTNAVATKKYIDWVKSKPEQRVKALHDYGREFWYRHKNDLPLWNLLWHFPLESKGQILHSVPADLRLSILHAKLMGAFAIFPKSGCYLGEWSFDFSTSKQDWNMGLYTLFPRFAHERIHPWKGFLRVVSDEGEKKKFKKNQIQRTPKNKCLLFPPIPLQNKTNPRKVFLRILLN